MGLGPYTRSAPGPGMGEGVINENWGKAGRLAGTTAPQTATCAGDMEHWDSIRDQSKRLTCAAAVREINICRSHFKCAFSQSEICDASQRISTKLTAN